MFFGSFVMVFINVYFNPIISSYDIHKSIMKNIPFSPTLPSTYSSTALLPIYDVSWLMAVQKLQLQTLVCLFLDAYGLRAALQFVQMGGAILMGLTGTIKGE